MAATEASTAPIVPPEPTVTMPPGGEDTRSLEERARAALREKPSSPSPLREPPPGTSMSRRRVMPYDPRDDKPVAHRSIFNRKDTPAWESYGTPKRRPYRP